MTLKVYDQEHRDPYEWLEELTRSKVYKNILKRYKNQGIYKYMFKFVLFNFKSLRKGKIKDNLYIEEYYYGNTKKQIKNWQYKSNSSAY